LAFASIFVNYLLKTEPSGYSFADLQRDKETIWDGVSNPVALKHLRAMREGDHLIIYETADVKSAVGSASVVSVDVSDAKNPRVKIKAGKPLTRRVTLAEMKSNKLFEDSPLVRQGRLSVVPLSEEQYSFLITN
jgi:predicted RNA-binding protein with PUA-like domain